jgi:hypothetical protein
MGRRLAQPEVVEREKAGAERVGAAVGLERVVAMAMVPGAAVVARVTVAERVAAAMAVAVVKAKGAVAWVVGMAAAALECRGR